jgi:hypothetical protein
MRATQECVVHEGFSAHRLKQNPLEAAYAKAWAEQAPHTLGWLLKNYDTEQVDYSPRDAQVAATMIQWLGSPVGSSFVAEVLDSAEKSNRDRRAY